MSNLDDSSLRLTSSSALLKSARIACFLSPPRWPLNSTSSKATEDIIEWANELSSSSYVFDSVTSTLMTVSTISTVTFL